MKTYKITYKYTFWNELRKCETWTGVECLAIAETPERAKEIFLKKLKSLTSVPLTEQISSIAYFCPARYLEEESISCWIWLKTYHGV